MTLKFPKISVKIEICLNQIKNIPTILFCNFLIFKGSFLFLLKIKNRNHIFKAKRLRKRIIYILWTLICSSHNNQHPEVPNRTWHQGKWCLKHPTEDNNREAILLCNSSNSIRVWLPSKWIQCSCNNKWQLRDNHLINNFRTKAKRQEEVIKDSSNTDKSSSSQEGSTLNNKILTCHQVSQDPPCTTTCHKGSKCLMLWIEEWVPWQADSTAFSEVHSQRIVVQDLLKLKEREAHNLVCTSETYQWIHSTWICINTSQAVDSNCRAPKLCSTRRHTEARDSDTWISMTARNNRDALLRWITHQLMESKLSSIRKRTPTLI